LISAESTSPIPGTFSRSRFFSLNIDKDIKGFTLLLKSICYNNTNTYIAKKPIKGNINISELSNLLDIDRKTVDKYLKKAIDNQLIEVTGDRIVIINDHFPLRVSNNIYAEAVKAIQDICIKYKTAMPLIDKKDINRIIVFYPLSESDISKIDDEENIKRYSLKYTLDNRIKKLPKDFSINYLFEILNIPKQPIKEPISFENIKIV